MSDNKSDIAVLAADRERTIVKTSIIGIVTNLFLVGFKAFVGLVSNSIAVILDAVNNLSDAASSVVTIIGAKLGAKQPDKKHQLGYGRIEYLSSMVVAALVLRGHHVACGIGKEDNPSGSGGIQLRVDRYHFRRHSRKTDTRTVR